jgi:hypothetical protein
MGDIFKVTWRTSITDVVSEFGLYYEQSGGGTGSDAPRNCAASCLAGQLATLKAILSEQTRIEAVTARRVTGGTAPVWIANIEDGAGSAGTNALHAQQCMLVNLRNEAGLLKRSGRLFISGIGTTNIYEGVIDATFISINVAAWLVDIKDVAAGGEGDWEGSLVVYKRYTDGVKLDPPVAVPVTDMDVTDILGTQHVRKGKLLGFTDTTP